MNSPIRLPQYSIDSMFVERWSPRAFSEKKVQIDMLHSLFEAARWAPSCYNDQPWLFLFASSEDDLKLYRSLLVEANQLWANKAPVLVFALARKKFSKNEKENAWSEFDTGAAWMSLALQANKVGLYAHAMAGFNEEQVYMALNIPKDDYKVMCAIAIGYKGEPDELPERYAMLEYPNDRKPYSDVVREGKF